MFRLHDTGISKGETDLCTHLCYECSLVLVEFYVGLFDLMLCSRCVCLWSLPPCALEYWRYPNNYWMYWNNDLAAFMSSLWTSKWAKFTVFLGLCRSFNFLTLLFFLCQQKRLSLLFVSAVLEGASVGPLIKVAIDVDPRCVIVIDQIFCQSLHKKWMLIVKRM